MIAELLTFWPIALVGLVILGVLGFFAFALCLEAYTRAYGEAGGPPWERR